MKVKLTTPILAIFMAISKSYAQYESLADECTDIIPYVYDSGNVSADVSTDVTYESPWVQLDLSQVQLANNAVLKLIGEKTSQEFDATSIESNPYSAVFDGGTVHVELTVDNSSSGGGLFRRRRQLVDGETSRVVISSIKVACKDFGGVEFNSICGAVGEFCFFLYISYAHLSIYVVYEYASHIFVSRPYTYLCNTCIQMIVFQVLMYVKDVSVDVLGGSLVRMSSVRQAIGKLLSRYMATYVSFGAHLLCILTHYYSYHTLLL